MHSENELGYQTRSDGFGILYGEIAGALIERCGRNGMGIVRKAVAAYGKKKGKRLREQYMGSGVRTDLHNLMAAEDGRWKDPRTLKTTVRDTPEAQLWEIYSCPLEKNWRDRGREEAGRLYCEEYLHALMDGYGEGAGQANVSNSKTCRRDDRCVMAMYCRTANQNETQKGTGDGNGIIREIPVEESTLLLYRCFIEVMKEEKDAEVVAAVTYGIKNGAEIMAETLIKKADHVGRSLDEDFLMEFFPFCRMEELREDRILRQCFLHVFDECLQKGGWL